MHCIWCDREHEGKASSCNATYCVKSLKEANAELQRERDLLAARVAELEALAVVGSGAIAHLPDPSDGECAIFMTIRDRGPFDLRRSESGWRLMEIVGDNADWNVYEWNAATWQGCLYAAGLLESAEAAE